MTEIIVILVGTVLVNNFVLTYFLGLCPFLGVSNSLETSARLGLATTFVMLVTAVCAWVLNTYVLIHAPYLRLICFIVVIASTVQFIEMLIKKLSPALFRAMGIFLPLITTNCAVMGACVLNIDKEFHRIFICWECVYYIVSFAWPTGLCNDHFFAIGFLFRQFIHALHAVGCHFVVNTFPEWIAVCQDYVTSIDERRPFNELIVCIHIANRNIVRQCFSHS